MIDQKNLSDENFRKLENVIEGLRAEARRLEESYEEARDAVERREELAERAKIEPLEGKNAAEIVE